MLMQFVNFTTQQGQLLIFVLGAPCTNKIQFNIDSQRQLQPKYYKGQKLTSKIEIFCQDTLYIPKH